MATRSARDTITRALKRLGIVAEMETVSSDQANDALIALNDMLNGFRAMGIQYAHRDLTLDDNLNVPDEQTRNVALMLCRELADDYGKALSPSLAESITTAAQSLKAYYLVLPKAQVDYGLRRRRPGTVDITRLP